MALEFGGKIYFVYKQYKVWPSCYLDVGNSTSNIAVMGEVGWKFPYQRQWENVAGLCGRLCNRNNERLTKKLFLRALELQTLDSDIFFLKLLF